MAVFLFRNVVSRLQVLLLQGLVPVFAILALALLPRSIVAQQIAPLLRQDPLLPRQGLSFGVDKLANTYVFTGLADVTLPVFGGELRWVNNYRGTAFRTASLAVRDDEFSHLDLQLPLSKVFAFQVRQSWTLSRDSRDVGLSSLERLNGAVGFRYLPTDDVTVEALTGVERNTQIGRTASGVLTGLRASAREVDLDDWRINARGLVDYHRMDAMRTNTDADLQADVLRMLDDGSEIRLAARYTSLTRDFLTSIGSLGSDLAVESRLERRITIDATVATELASNVRASVVAAVQTAGIDRQYGAPLADVAITAVNRRLGELVVDITGTVDLTLPTMQVQAGAALFRRDEQNGVDPRFAIDDVQLRTLRQQENQRDNATLRTRAFGRFLWRLSPSDTVNVDGSSSILRYDTPSDQNADDRDELNAALSVQYGRYLTDILSAGVAVSGQYAHLVFLRASRSALNNVNRVIRLAPWVQVSGSVVSMRPQAEVLANYTVYDFEGRGAAVRSYSFRQVSLRDSITVRCSPTISLESQILLRYFERATLAWDRFSESPETSSLERLTKFLIFSRPGPAVAVGTGIRLYSIAQQAIDAVPFPASGFRFWAPEVAVRYTAPNGSELMLDGWYEFRTVLDGTSYELPNLLLQARVVF